MIQPRLFFGMHPNAEINFRTAECDKVFELLTMLAGRVSTHELVGTKITWIYFMKIPEISK